MDRPLSERAELAALSPLQVLAVLGALAGLLALLTPPQHVAANIFLFFGAFLAAIHPRNGLFFTLLCAPLFLGEPQDPFNYVLAGLAGLTIIAWLIHLGLVRRRPRIPLLGWILFLAALILADLPLNLKEMFATLDFLGGRQVIHLLVEGRKYHDLFALRSLVFHLGGLAFLACCLDLFRAKDLKPLGLCLGLVSLLLTLVSLAWWLKLLPQGGFYLGLNLTGLVSRHGQSLLATTAFNRQYFNELLVLFLAFSGGVAVWTRGWARWGGVVAGLAALLCLLLTGQRTPFLSLAAMVVTAGGLVVWLRGRQGLRPAIWGLVGVVVVVGLAFGLDLALKTNLFAERFLSLASGDPVAGVGLRPQVWQVAWSMIKAHPLTGTGPGTFTILAREFAELAGVEMTPALAGVVGTAHNTYLQWAATLGLFSFLAAIVLGARLIAGGLQAYKEGPHRAEAGVILASLAGYIVFGLFQHILYVNAIALLIIGALAALAVLHPPRPWKVGRLGIIIALCLIALVLATKAADVNGRPFRANFRAGFNPGEWQRPEDNESWWTSGRRALLTTRPNKRYLVLPLSMPHGIVFGHPQRVWIWVDEDHKAGITLRDPEWHKIKLDLKDLIGQPVRIKIETGYAFSPFAFDGAPDRRRLGVMVGDFTQED